MADYIREFIINVVEPDSQAVKISLTDVDTIKFITGRGAIQTTLPNYQSYFQTLSASLIKARSWKGLSENVIVSMFKNAFTPVIIYMIGETKDNVEVIIAYPDGTGQNLYQMNTDGWQIYPGKLTVTKNGVLKAKKIYPDSSETPEAQLTVFLEYADRPYVTAQLSPDRTTYTVAIDFKDYTEKYYRTGLDINYKPYIGPFVINQNMAIYAYGVSALNGQSETVVYFCHEIYVRRPSIKYDLSPDKTTAQIIIDYGTLLYKYYKTEEDTSWLTYTGPFAVSDNTIIYAKAANVAGAESYIASLAVDKIITL